MPLLLLYNGAKNAKQTPENKVIQTAGSVIATIIRNYFEQFAVLYQFLYSKNAAMVPKR
jgi:hypothetical protein